MSMGGKGPEVLVTLTTDIGKILDGLHRTKIIGNSHLSTAIQVAAVSRACWKATYNADNFIARPQTQTKQIPASANNSLHLLSHRRRREIPRQARQENEKSQRIHRLHRLRRPRPLHHQETRILQRQRQGRRRLTPRRHPPGPAPPQRQPRQHADPGRGSG